MEALLYTEINVIGLVLLIIMFTNLDRKHGRKDTFDQSLFKLLLVSTAVVIAMDTVTWVINGVMFPGAIEFNTIFTTVYYSMQPVICLLWMLYSDYKLNEDTAAIKRKLPLYSIPVVVTAIMSILSYKTSWIFYIDATNTYQRGTLFFIAPILAFSYLFYVFFLTVRNAKDKQGNAKRELYKYLLAGPVLVMVGAMIQFIKYGLSCIWIGTTIAELIVFINIQNKQVLTDALTGLYNRRYLEKYLASATRSIPSDKSLFMMLADVDDFKGINDTFGHSAGDKALVTVADLMREYAIGSDVIARFGGDEFVICGLRPKGFSINSELSELNNHVTAFNAKTTEPYRIGLSVGCAVYGTNGINSIDALIQKADENMYAVKPEKKVVAPHSAPPSALASSEASGAHIGIGDNSVSPL